MNGRSPDNVDVAIATAHVPPKQVELRQVNLTLAPNGRPAIMALPADLTDQEAIELFEAVYQAAKAILAARPAARIIQLPPGTRAT